MPDTLTAADFSRLRLRWGAEPAPGELPAAIEHRFDAGRMVDHYLVTPAPALWALPGLPARAGVAGILFCQQADGAPWQVLLHPADDGAPAEAEMSAAEFAECRKNPIDNPCRACYNNVAAAGGALCP